MLFISVCAKFLPNSILSSGQTAEKQSGVFFLFLFYWEEDSDGTEYWSVLTVVSGIWRTNQHMENQLQPGTPDRTVHEDRHSVLTLPVPTHLASGSVQIHADPSRVPWSTWLINFPKAWLHCLPCARGLMLQENNNFHTGLLAQQI